MYVVIGIVVLLVLFLAFVASRPSEFRMARSTEIDAPADRIYPHVADFHHWEAWSPFEKYDPNMTKTYSGPPSGRGAVYEWSGNKRAGQGRMEIVDADAPRKAAIDLHFMKPFDARNLAEFKFEPISNGTRVTWAMSGKNNFTAKIFHAFFNMEKWLGKEFDEGLAGLKRVTEGETIPR